MLSEMDQVLRDTCHRTSLLMGIQSIEQENKWNTIGITEIENSLTVQRREFGINLEGGFSAMTTRNA